MSRTVDLDWTRYPSFTPGEFRCRGIGCCSGLIIVHPGFLERLQLARNEFGKSMHVLSGCRCKVHNEKPAALGGAGGHPRSLHVCDAPMHPGQEGTIAVDIAAVDGTYRGELFTLLWKHGFSVGWNAKRSFLHGDMRVWLGMKQTSFDY